MAKITDINKDLPILNDKLAQIDQLQVQINQQKQLSAQINQQLAKLNGTQDGVAVNSLDLTWTGSTLTISWPAGFVRNTSHDYEPFPAGSQAGLSASTNYWIGWNPFQQAMSIQASINTLQNIRNISVICEFYTGTAGQSGPAGGGGTEVSGTGLNGRPYKLF